MKKMLLVILFAMVAPASAIYSWSGAYSTVTLIDSTDTAYVYRIIISGTDTHDIKIPMVWSWASEVAPRRKLSVVAPQEWDNFIVKVGVFYGDSDKDFAVYYFTGYLIKTEPFHYPARTSANFKTLQNRPQTRLAGTRKTVDLLGRVTNSPRLTVNNNLVRVNVW
jgi:hypothetical protein